MILDSAGILIAGSPWEQCAPDVGSDGTDFLVAWVGGVTALVGATMGVTQYNLKKVLAYSTMSQIGLMVMACGVGACLSCVIPTTAGYQRVCTEGPAFDAGIVMWDADLDLH